jgi:hypothetical protein
MKSQQISQQQSHAQLMNSGSTRSLATPSILASEAVKATDDKTPSGFVEEFGSVPREDGEADRASLAVQLEHIEEQGKPPQRS